MKKANLLVILGIIFSLICFPLKTNGQSAEQIGKLYEKLKWRSIGPAVMGGRTVDIDVVEKEPWIIYAAIGPSGVWKSVNNGITWKPVFFKENTVSVGDIAIAQSHPDIVWVGTGEATSRNSVTIGDGVYKSTNGGKNWENMGLKDTRHISRIVINPGDPNIVYVAAMGHLWGPNKERGIYKTINGGKTWKKVLYINENTGFADLAIDPSDSLVLYAAAYEHRRLPYYFSSGGPGSGLYKTTDGGENWIKLTKDLPEGIMGRIGIDVSRSNPNVVYALIEHEDGGIWRSEDKGKNWTRTCDNETYKQVNNRPFYYSQIRIDPSDDKVVYVFSGGSFVSKNMGEKFRAISAGTHPDHHALWIDPSNPLHLIDGNDGGIDITYDGGKSWHAIQHMALAEVYQIGFDKRNPYYVYCGLQDNGSWGGPSASLDTAGIINDDWYTIGGGDGFYAQVDPSDPNIIYRNYQINGLSRFDKRINQAKTIKPMSSLEEPPYRFNWNSPIYISPHDPKTVYTGGNYLFKTTDEGHSWEIISPDLSTNDPEKLKNSGGPITMDNTGAEIHCTIITIAESPVKKGVLWCGTDDGNVQITLDGGKTWKNVVKKIKGIPPNTWCSRIEASRFDAGTAYVAFDGHRHDDYGTYVYKTTDFGKTWKSIKGNLPFGWVHVIREDLKNRNLLYVGTEFEIFATLDGGKSWFSLKNNLPTVAVRDIAVHPRENDLIIGTHGRGIWILDDISPIQEMTEEIFNSDIHLFNIRPAVQFLRASTREYFSAQAYTAKNPSFNMRITSYFRIKPEERPEIFIKDTNGETIFKIKPLKKEGIQKSEWSLQYVPKTKKGKEIKSSSMGFVAAPFVLPGEYTIEMVVGEQKFKKKGTVRPDPRFQMSEKDRVVRNESMVEVMVLSRMMGLSVTSTKNVRNQLEKLEKSLEEKGDTAETVRTAIKDFNKKFAKIEEEIMPKGFGYRGSMEMALRGGSISTQVLLLGISISGYPSAPTETDLTQLKELSEAVNELVNKLNEFLKAEIPKLNEILEKQGIKPLRAPKEVKL
ncbi:MAG: hypothetical protein HQ555_03370 [Candidatus Aminicenantes bacterium]|nr:hypothetical protein [Candidatus Aminicenantes bacterium]